MGEEMERTKVGLELMKRGRYAVFVRADETRSRPFASIETGSVIINQLPKVEGEEKIDEMEARTLRHSLKRSALAEKRTLIDDLIDQATTDGVCDISLLDQLIDKLSPTSRVPH